LREIPAMITEKRGVARNSQAKTNDCNEESLTDMETVVFDMEPV